MCWIISELTELGLWYAPPNFEVMTFCFENHPCCDECLCCQCILLLVTPNWLGCSYLSSSPSLLYFLLYPVLHLLLPSPLTILSFLTLISLSFWSPLARPSLALSFLSLLLHCSPCSLLSSGPSLLLHSHSSCSLLLSLMCSHLLSVMSVPGSWTLWCCIRYCGVVLVLVVLCYFLWCCVCSCGVVLVVLVLVVFSPRLPCASLFSLTLYSVCILCVDSVALWGVIISPNCFAV